MKKEIIIGNGKYKIVKKIGSGRFATCWEAEVLGDEKKDNVAIKIFRNKRYCDQSGKYEIEFYESLEKHDNVLTFIESFKENEMDTCIVFEKMDKSLLDLIQVSKTGIPLDKVKNIIKQMLQGLDHLHKGGIVHTDLKPENILIKEEDGELIVKVADLGNACFLKDINKLNRMRNQDVIERYDDLCEERKVIRYKYLISLDSEEQDESDKAEIKRLEKTKDIREYRRLCKEELIQEYEELEKKVPDNIGTTEYNSVEAIIGSDYDTSTDIWSVACIMFEALTNDYLFNPHSFCDSDDSEIDYGSSDEEDGDDDSDDDSDDGDDSDMESDSDSDNEEKRLLIDQMHLWLMTRTLGEIPKYVSRRGDFMEDFFNNAGNIKSLPQFLKEKSISYTLNYDFNFDIEEAKKIEEFMLSMLQFDNEKRINAEDALKLEFLA